MTWPVWATGFCDPEFQFIGSALPNEGVGTLESANRHEVLLCFFSGTKYCFAFSGSFQPLLRGFRCFWPPAQGGDGHLVGQELCCGRTCFHHGRSSLSCCSRAHSMRLFFPFVLPHLPLTLFFFSWTFLPVDYPLSLTYLGAHFILRAQPGLFQSPADA